MFAWYRLVPFFKGRLFPIKITLWKKRADQTQRIDDERGRKVKFISGELTTESWEIDFLHERGKMALPDPEFFEVNYKGQLHLNVYTPGDGNYYPCKVVFNENADEKGAKVDIFTMDHGHKAYLLSKFQEYDRKHSEKGLWEKYGQMISFMSLAMVMIIFVILMVQWSEGQVGGLISIGQQYLQAMQGQLCGGAAPPPG